MIWNVNPHSPLLVTVTGKDVPSADAGTLRATVTTSFPPASVPGWPGLNTILFAPDPTVTVGLEPNPCPPIVRLTLWPAVTEAGLR